MPTDYLFWQKEQRLHCSIFSNFYSLYEDWYKFVNTKSLGFFDIRSGFEMQLTFQAWLCKMAIRKYYTSP